MESSDFVRSVQAEKANALARYRLFTFIAKAVQLLEVLVAVTVISWSSARLPSVFKFSSEYLLALTSSLINQHVVFLVGNVIVVVCYVLSRFTDSGNESSCSGIQYHNGKNRHLTHLKIVHDAPNPKLVPLQVTESPVERQNPMIINQKAIIETVNEPEVEAVTAIKQAAKQIERFRRTQSALKRSMSVKPDGELRRSVTERRRRSMTVNSCDFELAVKSSLAVDTLSNEEFRIAVEKFISKQQRFLKQQSIYG